MSIEGEHMIPGEEAWHTYFQGCECVYCLRITRAKRQHKVDMAFAMEYASEHYDMRKREEESK